jgi:hypothetical protein
MGVPLRTVRRREAARHRLQMLSTSHGGTYKDVRGDISSVMETGGPRARQGAHEVVPQRHKP